MVAETGTETKTGTETENPNELYREEKTTQE